MASFDVVSRIDFQEIDNAIANALREITNRYDFKGSDTSLERSDKTITVITDDELKLRKDKLQKTRRYRPLCGPSSSSCGGLRP